MHDDSWKQFAATGRVWDYLEYKGCIDRANNLSIDKDAAGSAIALKVAEREAEESGRYSHSDGNDTYSVTDERVR